TSKARKGPHVEAKAGRHIYAMNHDDDIYSADSMGEFDASYDRIGAFSRGQGPKPEHVDVTHHSSFFEGQALDEFGYFDHEKSKGTKGSGEVAVNEGWLSRISNVSGHYKPFIRNTYATLQALEKKGANLDSTTVENSNGKSTQTYQARAMLASGL